ncbi:expressed protein [Phakopsora pachyrhizi]|uniref:Transcription initiation factor TFIID subunit 2 n=1 Tax=Phakopsora pachyrhizi TaxID=170000 RepID=A0AAV0AW48_PHAPC|nr:expressed protein [Phakopsora pachyrhizi]
MNPLNRGFTISHQRVILDIDLNGQIDAVTEISVLPLSAQLNTLHLHCEKLLISSISSIDQSQPSSESSSSSSSSSLNFILNEPDQVQIPDPSSVKQFPEAKRRLFERINEKEAGELIIELKPSLIKTIDPKSSDAQSSSLNTPSNQTNAVKESHPEFEPFTIRIEYSVPTSAKYHHLPNSSICLVEDPLSPHLFTNSTSARSWIPCLDSLWERCTWELEFIVPRFIKLIDNSQADSVDHSVIVVSSGECLEQVIHPSDLRKAIFYYSQPILTSVQHLAWVVGPLEVLDLSPSSHKSPSIFDNRDDLNHDESLGQIKLYAFCLPNKKSQLLGTVQFLSQVFSFFTGEYGSYPYSSYKVVFVNMSSATHSIGTNFNSATLTIYPSDLLYPPEVIDQVYETKPTMVQSLSAQWVGINIIPKSPADTWLINGLSLYITGLYFKSIWGTNEYKYRIKKDMLRCVEMDVNKPPICQPGLPSAIDAESGRGASFGLSRVISKIFLSAISGEMKENMLSTNSFLRICRKLNGNELKSWAEQWIYSSGCPIFEVTAIFNRKKMMHELNLKQINRCKTYYHSEEHDSGAGWEEKTNLKPVDRFEGQMSIRIHESDGIPYEHVLDIKDNFKKYELPSNHKNHRRLKRTSKRYLTVTHSHNQEEETADDDREDDLLVGEPIWKDDRDRERWRIVDWSEEEDLMMGQSGVEWIRLDVEIEWICGFQFEMSSYMWLEQLQRERDVVAQFEAVQALRQLPSQVVSSYLCQTILSTNYFFKIRIEAILALVSCASHQYDYIGLFHLFKIFQEYYCYQPKLPSYDPFKMRMIPKPNSFEDFIGYFIRKAVVVAISQIRDRNGNPPSICQNFFLDQLIYNDNSCNKYSDAHYLSTIITSISDAFIDFPDRTVRREEKSELFSHDSNFFIKSNGSTHERRIDQKKMLILANELERCLIVDRLVPSYRNLITLAVIEAKLKMTLAGLIPVDLFFFLACTREGNYPPIRILGFDCLLLLRAFQEKAIIRYMFLVMREDRSLLVKRRLAQGLVQCLPILVFMEELSIESANHGLSVIEGITVHSKNKNKFDHKSVTKQLRVEVGRALILRECIMSVMLDPEVDVDVQTCLLKISEVLFKPSDESVPIKISNPTEPVTTTPTLPKIRIPASSTTIEAVQPPVQAPLPKIILRDQQQQHQYQLMQSATDDQNQISSQEAEPIKQNDTSSKLVATLIKRPKPKKFQASGMSIPDHKMCQNLLKKITNHALAAPFRKPVDPIRDNAPNYFNIISRPMDFKTMSDKLEMGQYTDREAFRSDFDLVLENCKTYNMPDSSLVLKHAEPMRLVFEKLWERSEKTMNALQAKGIGGASAGWKSLDMKPLVPPPNSLPIAPPPSFADFAAGGSKITPAPPFSSLPTSTTSPQLSPPVPKSGGLKVKLKSRGPVNPAETPSMPPPTSKPSLKIKFPSSSTPKTSGEVSRVAAPIGPNFPAPPPPTFAVTPAPSVSLTRIKAKVPPPPTFPPPSPPTIEPLSISSKPQSSSFNDFGSNDKTNLDSLTSKPTCSKQSLLQQATTADPKSLMASPGSRHPKRPTIIAKLSKPPPAPEFSMKSGASQTGLQPNFPAPPPPSIPDLSLNPSSRPSSVSSGPSKPTKIKVIQRSSQQPVDNVTILSTVPPLVKPAKSSTKPPKNACKVTKVNLTTKALEDKSRSNSVEPPLYNSTPVLEASTSPSPKKPKSKKATSNGTKINITAQNSPNSVQLSTGQSLSRTTSSSSIPLSSSTSFRPSGALASSAGLAVGSKEVERIKRASSLNVYGDETLNVRKAKGILKKMIDLPFGIWFRAPVDPVAVGAPTYYDEIRNPMDLTTMIKNLDRGLYQKQKDLMRDFDLIVANCIQFNGVQANVSMDALQMEKAWKTEWEKASKLSYNDKRALLGLFNKLNQVPGVEVFSEPVDPVRLEIPNYFIIIGGQENARDLGTIKKKLTSDGYHTLKQFEVDIRQMLVNCFKFNPPETPVALIGKDLEKVFEAEMNKIKRGVQNGGGGGGGGGNITGTVGAVGGVGGISGGDNGSSNNNKRKGNESGSNFKRPKMS